MTLFLFLFRKTNIHPNEKQVINDKIHALIYGNCIGDAIGLLTEFMNKEQALHVRWFMHFIII